MTPPAAMLLGIPWKRFGLWLVKSKVWILAFLKPLGVWAILLLAFVDSASIPLPLDPLVVSYGATNHGRVVLYCLMAALGSALGSLIPYYLGRVGGELFLLKRINRKRYEKLRDRFEKQEFLAIMLPAMCPPPMPIKLFELAAGVFEMRPVSYFLAIATGKFIRFLVESILVIVYGPAVLGLALSAVRNHLAAVLSVVGLIILALALYILRKIFDRKRPLPLEADGADEPSSDAGDEL